MKNLNRDFVDTEEWIVEFQDTVSQGDVWCDKAEHDAKVDEWELSQVLYEGFVFKNSAYFKFYGLNSICVEFFDGLIAVSKYTNGDTINFNSNFGITLHQFEAITGLKMIER